MKGLVSKETVVTCWPRSGIKKVENDISSERLTFTQAYTPHLRAQNCLPGTNVNLSVVVL